METLPQFIDQDKNDINFPSEPVTATNGVQDNAQKTAMGMVGPAPTETETEQVHPVIDPVLHPSTNKTSHNYLPNINTLEIRQGDLLIQPRALHSPVTNTLGAPQHRSATLPKTHIIINPNSLEENKIHSIIDDVQKHSTGTSGNVPHSTHAKSHSHTSPTPSRWVLTPRRGHAALNAGIRSLGDRDVTLVAYPGELLDENNEILSESEISPQLKEALDLGLESLAKGQDRKKGIRCKAVWLEEKLSQNFYEGYCKGYLWPIFHYFVSFLLYWS